MEGKCGWKILIIVWEVQGDVFLPGSQFMTSVTTLISELFVPYHANWWSPSWAINSSPEVNLSCVWGVCCHPHWVQYCCKQAAHTIKAPDFSGTRGLVTQHCAASTESSCRGGWGAQLSFQKPTCFLPAPTPKQPCQQGEGGQRKLQAVPRLGSPERAFCSGVLVSFAPRCCNLSLSKRRKRKTPFTRSWSVFCV